jgi:hypothetical protein
MPLIDLKTNLKSLRFGNDRPGNYSSADARGAFAAFPNGVDPLIPPNEDEDQGVQGFTSSNEFGIRGGLLRVGAAVDDVERLFKLYTKTNVGLSFNAKQITQGLLADPFQVWNPLATTIQSALNIPGIGHYPAFFNPSPESFGDFLNPLAIGPTDLRSSTKLKPGESDVYGIGKVAIGTNNLLKGTVLGSPIGSRIRRKRGVSKTDEELYNVVYDKRNPGVQLTTTADRMAMKPLYNSSTVASDVENSDFIKFRISVVNNDNPSLRTWITFRAFIDSFSDSFNAQWSDVKYVGRGENFKTYGGFGREISMGFTVAVQSRQEQFPLYEKLNYLASLCAPDYSDEGFMRGNLVYLTVGDYLRDVPGVLKGISIGGFEQSSWEIAKKLNGNPLGKYNKRGELLSREEKVAQLPHVLKVSGFSFTPIHNFVPQKGSKFIGYDPADDIIPKALTNDEIDAQAQAALDEALNTPDQFL